MLEEFFLPMNARVGSSLFMELDDYNSVSFAFDVNKLLAPTPQFMLLMKMVTLYMMKIMNK